MHNGNASDLVALETEQLLERSKVQIQYCNNRTYILSMLMNDHHNMMLCCVTFTTVTEKKVQECRK